LKSYGAAMRDSLASVELSWLRNQQDTPKVVLCDRWLT
jgi:hypothetical protein